MSNSALKICVEALSLPREMRADLAHRLLVSLENEVLDHDAEKAWKALSEERFEGLKKGTTSARDAKVAVNAARENLRG